jgi:hypothetical protein
VASIDRFGHCCFAMCKGADAEQLDAAADQAIAACGGNARNRFGRGIVDRVGQVKIAFTDR